MSTHHTSESAITSHRPAEDEAAWLSIVKRQVKALHFGVVQVVVHNDRVVQVEWTEKVRLNDKTAGDGMEPTI